MENDKQPDTEADKERSCCSNPEKKGSCLGSAILYGLLPHSFCIAFVLFAAFGVTAGAFLFRPLMLNPYFFYILIALSVAFATVSSIIYLKRNDCLSVSGAKTKRGYLSTMYGTVIGINLLLFFVIFPTLANLSAAGPTGFAIAGADSKITLKVDIPCSGHASLISSELKTLPGVKGVRFRSPVLFDVTYDSSITSEEQMLGLDVFKTYDASVVG